MECNESWKVARHSCFVRIRKRWAARQEKETRELQKQMAHLQHTQGAGKVAGMAVGAHHRVSPPTGWWPPPPLHTGEGADT